MIKRIETFGWALAACVAVVATACGTTVVDRTRTGGGGTGGTGGTGPASSVSVGDGSGGNPCYPDSCSGPTTGSGGPPLCGGLAGATCSDGYYCAFDNGTCGGDDSGGVCLPMPGVCDEPGNPVCGCDGQIYASECAAHLAGFDVSSATSCMFACGTGVCHHGTEYCQISTSGGQPYDVVCLPVPDTCNGEPSCDCISCGSCEQSPSGDVTVTCGD